MELTELQDAWKQQSVMIEKTLGNARQVTLKHTIDGRLRREPIVDVILSAVTLLWTGGFLGSHAADLLQHVLFALPALAVHGLAIYILGQAIRQLILLSQVDYAQPIAQTQTLIGRLRSMRLKTIKSTLHVGIVVWFAFPILLLQTLAGPSVIARIDPPWLVCNILFGFAMMGGAVAFARKIGDSHPLAQKLNDALSGTQIKRAEQELAQFADLEP